MKNDHDLYGPYTGPKQEPAIRVRTLAIIGKEIEDFEVAKNNLEQLLSGNHCLNLFAYTPIGNRSATLYGVNTKSAIKRSIINMQKEIDRKKKEIIEKMTSELGAL